mmetsp:Transcript_123977/g.347176  ORF Transcript_123977/g.347176 Transcript_123977/m.347176 type:complete len:245 (-) Transcript_123977:174-908(-)
MSRSIKCHSSKSGTSEKTSGYMRCPMPKVTTAGSRPAPWEAWKETSVGMTAFNEACSLTGCAKFRSTLHIGSAVAPHGSIVHVALQAAPATRLSCRHRRSARYSTLQSWLLKADTGTVSLTGSRLGIGTSKSKEPGPTWPTTAFSTFHPRRATSRIKDNCRKMPPAARSASCRALVRETISARSSWRMRGRCRGLQPRSILRTRMPKMSMYLLSGLATWKSAPREKRLPASCVLPGLGGELTIM